MNNQLPKATDVIYAVQDRVLFLDMYDLWFRTMRRQEVSVYRLNEAVYNSWVPSETDMNKSTF